jgi:hypothetical protein
MVGGSGVRSLIRYTSVYFPLWAGLAIWFARHRRASRVLVALWLILSTFLTIRLYRGLWVQ